MDNIGDLSAIWQIVLNDIRDESSMPQTAIDLWFGKFKMVSLSTDKVVFASDSEMKRGIIQDKYSEFLADHVYRVIGFRPEVQIVVDPSLSPITHKMRQIRAGEAVSAPTFQVNEPDFIFVGNEMDDDDDDYYDEQDNITSDPLLIEEKIISDHLAEQGGRSVIHSTEKRLTFNPDYTFENFIVGSSNSLAHSGALAVASTPGRKYNPLFLYGNSGLGKTHLMYSIANKVLERDPTMRVIYVKGEEFMNQLIEALREKTNSEFREKYRKADMLLIDDIQFIAGKESTQLEFFHTFDALYEDHKQIIITSDKPPREMVTLEERIRSRFESGLVVDIQPPDFELRLAILQNKADQNNLVIPTDVLTYLAERLQSNIRQIEGVIKKLGANHFLSGLPVTIEMVRSCVPEFLKESESENDLVKRIVECVANRFNTSPEEIYGRKRTKDIKNARNVATKIIRDMTSLSLPKIGALMGNRDYSTVHSNLQAVENQIVEDPTLEAIITDIIKEIKRK
ncbi:MAG: chromosomal replication initiator protein DnaA [Clostridia bacterium]|nr:chromosomal replication initiator protein DnaA [Clostridia bacterium]